MSVGMLSLATLLVLFCMCETAKVSMSRRSSFQQLKRSTATQPHEVIFAVVQHNITLLDKMLEDRSNPSSPLYQQWLSFDEVVDLTDNREGSAALEEWLSDNNIPVVWKSKRGLYYSASASVSTWESLLNSQFYEWQDVSQAAVVQHTRCTEYEIPTAIAPHVSAIFNTVQLPPVVLNIYKPSLTGFTPNQFKMNIKNDDLVKILSGEGIESSSVEKNTLLDTSQQIDVPFLRSYYDIPVTDASSSPRYNQSVLDLQKVYFSPSDLSLFQQTYNLTVQSAISLGGHAVASCVNYDCSEGNLDVQYIDGISQDTTTIFWYVNNSITGLDPFLQFLMEMSDDTNPPRTNSISWASYENSVGVDVLSSFNTEALKLSIMGVTIVAASGDGGAPGGLCNICDTTKTYTFQNCACNATTSTRIDGVSGGVWSGQGYFPYFPASSPYVTAVGATMGPEKGATSEVVCQSDTGGVITSGGGFSTYYAQPSWQSGAVSAYFSSLTSQPRSGYNPSGRAYPDVSLLGVSYPVIIAGSQTLLYGTSASAPVFAGMISVLNAHRLRLGLPSVGFVNPTLYAYGGNSAFSGLFNDVVSGNNKCCGGTSCCVSGFSASVGWDPVSGWGSVDYPSLLVMFNHTTAAPTPTPTVVPSNRVPSVKPTSARPSLRPSLVPSVKPTTRTPTVIPTTVVPTLTNGPTVLPTVRPSSGAPTTVIPTALPSFQPTQVPTSRPTEILDIVFSVKMTLSGISLSVYNDSIHYETVLITSVASSMTNVNVSDIHNLTVVIAVANRRLDETETRLRTLAAADSVSVSFTVESVTYSETFSQLSSELTSAISSGSLATSLASAAHTYGLSGYDSVTASLVSINCTRSCSAATTDDAPVPDDTSSDSSSNSVLSLGAIIGIAVGGFAFLVIVAVGVYYCTSSRRSSVPTDGSRQPAANTVESSVPAAAGTDSHAEVDQVVIQSNSTQLEVHSDQETAV